MYFFTNACIVFVNLIIPYGQETFRPVRVQMLHNYTHVEVKARLPEENTERRNTTMTSYVFFATYKYIYIYVHRFARMQYQIRKSGKSF